jgi:hypothetical protein
MAAGDSTPDGPTANGRASLGTPGISAALAALAPSSSITDSQNSASGAVDGGPLSLSLSNDAAAAATVGSPFKRARASQAGADGSPVDVSAAKKASDIFGSIVGTASTPMDADVPPSLSGQSRSPLAPAPPVGGSRLRRSIGGGVAEDRNMEDEEL